MITAVASLPNGISTWRADAIGDYKQKHHNSY